MQARPPTGALAPVTGVSTLMHEQRSTRSDQRGGEHERSAGPPQASEGPLGGQRSTRSDKRGGEHERSAGPPQASEGPLGGQRSTRRDKRGGPRIQRRPVHGVLLLDKPYGLSSNDALQKAKWLLRAEKAGHTGTLDPLATGVLPLCFGAATKFSQLHLDADKAYVAVARLGQRTSSGDAEGAVVQQRDVPTLTQADLDAVAARFTGRISQVPPMHSALKHEGRALYELARAGIEVERAARSVTIFELKLCFRHDHKDFVAIEMIVKCSKGTYIRTLGEDIGEALGCGAHLVSLRRTATGPFDAGKCLTLDALQALEEPARMSALLPVEALLPAHARITLDVPDAGRFLSGLRRRGAWPDTAQVAVWGRQPAALLGTGHVQGGELIPTRLLSPIEISQVLAQPPVFQEAPHHV